MQWSAPEQIAVPRFSDSDGPSVIIRLRGNASWAFWSAAAGRGKSQIEAATRSPDGHWGTPTIIGPPSDGYIYFLEAALGPHGTAAVAWTSPNGDGSHSIVKVAYRTPDGSWQPPRDLGEGEVGGVTIADNGDVTVSWEARPASVDTVGNAITVSRLERGQWQSPQVIARAGWTPDVAANRHGEVALVWAALNGVGVSVRRSGTWEPPTLIKGIHYPDDPHITIDDRGRALALWARSTEEESYARRHLAWASTRADHSWTPAGFLDERPRRSVIGDQITLAMNSHGKAIAAWSPDSVDEGGFRVSEFTFASGWTQSRHLADFAYLPAALVTDTGIAVVSLNFSDPPGWVYRLPGADWVVGGRVTNRDPMGAFGDGHRMATIYLAGHRLMARFLLVRKNR